MQEKSFVNNQLEIKFNSYIDHKCRVRFKAKKVAQILGYKNTVDTIKKHVSENHKRKIVQQRETRGCTFTYLLDEAGFYELVFKSRLPSARIFREWVFFQSSSIYSKIWILQNDRFKNKTKSNN